MLLSRIIMKKEVLFLKMVSKIILCSIIFLNAILAIAKNNKSDRYKAFVSNQKKFITDEQLSISYTDEGKGETVLLLHGVPTSSWLYRDIIDSLVQQGKRVIAPDLIGYGQSDKPKDLSSYTYDKQSYRLFELMSSLDINKWTQVCHDMGSLVTWQMIDNDSLNKISKLVILNSILEKENFNPPMKFKKNFFGRSYSKIYCSHFGTSMIKTTLNNGMYKQKIDKVSLYGYVSPLKNAGHHALYQFFTDFDSAYKLIETNNIRLTNFKGNIIFLWGIHDEILTYEQINHTVNPKQENVTIIKLENSNHFVQEQELRYYIKYIILP